MFRNSLGNIISEIFSMVCLLVLLLHFAWLFRCMEVTGWRRYRLEIATLIIFACMVMLQWELSACWIDTRGALTNFHQPVFTATPINAWKCEWHKQACYYLFYWISNIYSLKRLNKIYINISVGIFSVLNGHHQKLMNCILSPSWKSVFNLPASSRYRNLKQATKRLDATH